MPKPENLDVIRDSTDDDRMKSNLSMPPKLSPTPRKSERDRKNISYDKLNKGALDSEEEAQQQGENSKNRKLEVKKFSVSEVHKRIEDLLNTMNNHEAADLFNQ